MTNGRNRKTETVATERRKEKREGGRQEEPRSSRKRKLDGKNR